MGVICAMPMMACNGCIGWRRQLSQQCKVLVSPVDETLEPLLGEDHLVDQPLVQRLVVH